KLGKAPPPGPGGPGGMTPAQLEQMRQVLGEERFREFMERQKELDQKKEKKDEGSFEEESFSDDELRLIEDIRREVQVQDDGDDPLQQKKGGGGKKFPGGGFGATDRSLSPDRKMYAYALNHNLYVAETGKDDAAIQLTKDSSGEDYTFNATGGGAPF